MQAAGPRLGALVLAAGRSERMGSPKALCRLGGRTLLSIALSNVADPRISARVVVVEDATGAVARELSGGGGRAVRVAVNAEPDLGPAESVRRGWRELPAGLDGCVVLPVDAALVLPADVARLLDAVAAETDPAIRVWVPSFGGRRGHPVVFHSSLQAEVEALPPREALHRLVRDDARRVRHVMAAHDGVLRDLDTPGDLAEAESRLAGPGGKGR